MGAWSARIFDNDDASDWVEELLQYGPDVLHSAFIPIDVPYLEVTNGVRLLCAGEVVAALLGRAAFDIPDEVRAWVETQKENDVRELVLLALTGVDRVLAQESELHELWQENGGEFEEWRKHATNLKARLTNAA